MITTRYVILDEIKLKIVYETMSDGKEIEPLIFACKKEAERFIKNNLSRGQVISVVFETNQQRTVKKIDRCNKT